MGYYLDFVFDQAENLDFEAVKERFMRAGATNLPHDPDRPSTDKVVELWSEKVGGMIDIRKQEPVDLKGYCAEIRISWAHSPETMGNILELAEAVGCRVYDGQLCEYLTRENLEKMQSEAQRVSNNVMGLFGKCKVKNTP